MINDSLEFAKFSAISGASSSGRPKLDSTSLGKFRSASAAFNSDIYSDRFKNAQDSNGNSRNLFDGIGGMTNESSWEEQRNFVNNTFSSAARGNKKAIRNAHRIASRIDLYKAHWKPDVDVDQTRGLNRKIWGNQVMAGLASIAPIGMTEEENREFIEKRYMGVGWATEGSEYFTKLIDDLSKIKAMQSYMDSIASRSGSEERLKGFAEEWGKASIDVKTDYDAMKKLMEHHNIAEPTPTMVERQAKLLQVLNDNIGNIEREIKTAEDNGGDTTGLKNKLENYKSSLKLHTALISSDFHFSVDPKSGRLVVAEKPDGESLIVQRLDPEGRVIYAVNESHISSLPPDRREEVRKRAEEALGVAAERAAFTPPAVIKVDTVGEGPLVTNDLNEYNEWKEKPENKKQVTALQEIVRGIAKKVIEDLSLIHI